MKPAFIILFFLSLLRRCTNTVVEISFWHFPTFKGSNNELSVILKQSAYLNSKFTSEFNEKCYKNLEFLVVNDTKSFTEIFNPADFLFIDDWHFSDVINETRLRQSLTENIEIYKEMVKTLTVITTSKKLIATYFNYWRFPSIKVDFKITSCKMIANGATQYIQQYDDKKSELYLAQHLHQYVIQGFINSSDSPYFFNSANLKSISNDKTYSPIITVFAIN